MFVMATLTLLLGEPAWAEEPLPQAPETVLVPARDPPLAQVVPSRPPQRTWHGADRAPRVRLGGERWDTWGWMRGRMDWTTDPPLDESGFQSGRQLWLSTRFVYGVDYHPSARVGVVLELEEANSPVAGDRTDVGTAADPEPFRVPRSDFKDAILSHPRQVHITLQDPRVGLLRLGAQTFSWGLGMLANDGAADPDFGDPDQGNINVRLLLATAPWRHKDGRADALRGLSFFAAGDVVVRDDNAWIYQGDLASQAVLGVRTQSARFDLGLLGVARFQRDRRDPLRPEDDFSATWAFPVDLYTRVAVTPLSWNHRVVLEAEAAVIHGHTTRPWLRETVETGARIQSAGFVGRVRYDHDPFRLTLKAEVGFATGDNDPRDRVVRGFNFHSDHEVGLLLFEQILPMLTARSVDRAADPSLVAVPTPGARFAINQGQVSNAVYVTPTVRWRPTEAADLRLGYLGAWSAGLFYDQLATGLSGGFPASWGGAPADRRFLGSEVDASARYRFFLPTNLAVEVGAEGGVFLPGGALEPVAMTAQGTVRARVDFFW